MALVKIYSGSEIEATPIKLTLEEAGINPVVKDNIQSLLKIIYNRLRYPDLALLVRLWNFMLKNMKWKLQPK